VILCSLHGYHCGCFTLFSWASKILWIEPAPFYPLSVFFFFIQPAFIFCILPEKQQSTFIYIRSCWNFWHLEKSVKVYLWNDDDDDNDDDVTLV
jgi:hypothetical protein